ncbi:hypothetical protein [Oceanobacter sp. 3_MG-2023]|uniref:hypothetical protein n=1 Tax=Oceanobacter sp. 3_MG-2023 TaxID=3062622 RepID=UPI002737335B|nr:hypothetical protein [Oceanobacter sp. 3_MG-2023]MDP2505647.1 hypothetical protein [Oceanobacter sp. 3_MG-2023]
MMNEQLYQVLAAGGDLGVWALVVVLWRFDRRLAALEAWVHWVQNGATSGPLFPNTIGSNKPQGQ